MSCWGTEESVVCIAAIQVGAVIIDGGDCSKTNKRLFLTVSEKRSVSCVG